MIAPVDRKRARPNRVAPDPTFRPPALASGAPTRAKALASAVLLLVIAACSATSDSTADCESTDSAGACSGSFSCGNSGIQISCDATSQVCVVQPGMVFCEAIPGASATHCPSPSDAASAAGCTTPFKPECSGSSGSGITVTCQN